MNVTQPSGFTQRVAGGDGGLVFMGGPAAVETFTYYVDSFAGVDANPGTAALPWQTIAKVNGTALSAGQSVGFKRGSVWRETLTPGQSGSAGNPITFGAYAGGAAPVISGADLITGPWTSVAGGGVLSDVIGDYSYPETYPNPPWGTPPAGCTVSGSRVTFDINATTGTPQLGRAIAAMPEAWFEYDVTVNSLSGVTGTNNIQGFGLRLLSGFKKALFVGLGVTTGLTFWRYTYSTNGADGTANTTIPAAAGQTYHIVGYYKASASGAGNGIARFWVDGVLAHENTAVANDVGAPNADTFVLGNNARSGLICNLTYVNALVGTSGVTPALPASSGVWSTPVATQPRQVLFGGQLGSLKPNRAGIAADRDWTWADGKLYVYAPSNPSGYYGRIEAGRRDSAVTLTGRSYLTLNGLRPECANGYVVTGNSATVVSQGLTYSSGSMAQLPVAVGGVGADSIGRLYGQAYPNVGSTKLNRSSDGGQNWVTLKALAGFASIRSVFISRGGVIFFSTNTCSVPADHGIWRSGDDGATWVKTADLDALYGVADAVVWRWAEDAAGAIYAGIYTLGGTGNAAQVLKSVDAGATWSNTGVINALGRHVHDVQYDPATGYLYTAIGDPIAPWNANGKGVFRSTDGGANWVRILAALPSVAAIGITPTARLFGVDDAAATHWGIYRSTDDTNATQVLSFPIGAQMASFWFQRIGTKMYAGFVSTTASDHAEAWFSEDDGLTWGRTAVFPVTAAFDGPGFSAQAPTTMLWSIFNNGPVTAALISG